MQRKNHQVVIQAKQMYNKQVLELSTYHAKEVSINGT